MKSRLLALLMAFLVLAAIVVVLFYAETLPGTFNPEDRYESDRLDYMGVIYSNRSDIYAFNEGYSETVDCPWGFVHNGLDYFFYNNSEVIAAAPGYVEHVSWRENPDTTLNMYNIYVVIRFNATIEISYTFEPFTHTVGDQNRQLEMLVVKEGDWVQKGDLIGHFLYVEEGAHIHFGITGNSEWVNPEPLFGGSDLLEVLGLIHSYHPDWGLSYPAP